MSLVAAESDALLLTAAGDGVGPAVLLTVAGGKRQYLFNVPEGKLGVLGACLPLPSFRANVLNEATCTHVPRGPAVQASVGWLWSIG